MILACLRTLVPLAAAATHYERPPCQGDEVQGEVLGVSGYVCAPRCAESTYDCPFDVPDLAAARPQCMLKDADNGAFCALLCTVDSQCPSSARCNKLAQAGVGMCMYPLAFSDWVRQGTTRRLTYGLPQRADKRVPPGIVQKAVAAVQNLKSKYGIQDGDADVVAVKEFLSALTTGGDSGGIVPSFAGSVPNISPLPSAVSATSVQQPTQSSQSEGSKTLNAWKHDIGYHTERLKEGVPGLVHEVTDAIDEIEHWQRYHALSDLLRHIIEITVVYLVVGMAYKYQALGARGMDMIPHISFWMEYPELVQDGIKYSVQVLGGYFGMDVSSSSGGSGGFLGGGGGGYEPMGRDRDTFAHFEPSKA